MLSAYGVNSREALVQSGTAWQDASRTSPGTMAGARLSHDRSHFHLAATTVARSAGEIRTPNRSHQMITL
jgi:hypothetical protein